MNKKFMLGALSGVSALAIGFPLAAQVAGAQSASGADIPAIEDRLFARPALTDDQLQKMIAGDQAILDNLDELVSAIRSATQAHKDALTAALSITDEDNRQEAVRAAMDARRDVIKGFMEANPELKDALPFGGERGHGRGPGPEKLAEKLGMTADELKAAIDGGQTIEQIAAEKGIELPARPMMGMMGGRGGHGGHMGGRLAEKLGMTPEALKAELDSGKTIEQIAEEKGVTLPKRPMFKAHFDGAFDAE